MLPQDTILHMFHPTFYFFLFTGVKRSGIRAAEISTNPAGDRYPGRIVIAALRAGKSFAGTVKFTFKDANVALINRGIGAIGRNKIGRGWGRERGEISVDEG